MLCSCNKEENDATPFYQVSVNGKETRVYACGTSDYVCEFLSDTAMFAGIGCGGQGAGFYLKGSITDGTYILNERNKAFYAPDQATDYKTNQDNKGMLTITTLSLDGIAMIQGRFEFKGIDTVTGTVLNFTNGSFLMKKIKY